MTGLIVGVVLIALVATAIGLTNGKDRTRTK
jgi:hypothetical protein